MFLVFSILIVLSSALLGLIVLIQNPKGGGLSGTFGGVGTQFMGVKQTTDVLEKGTWIFASLVGLLCLFSPLFLKKKEDATSRIEMKKGITPQKPATPVNKP
jgi:preprotein translocase subunit SecG